MSFRDSMSERARRILGYGIALGGPALATWLAWLLMPTDLLVPSLPYIVAIVIATVVGRLGAGLLASVASFAALVYYFSAPVGELAVDLRSEHVIALALFLAVAVCVAFVIDRLEGAITRRNESLALLDEALRDRERVVRDLQFSRDQLAVTLEGVGDAITVQDLAGNVVYANPAAATMLGVDDPETLLTTPIAEVMRNFDILDESGAPFPDERLPGRLALRGETPAEATVRWRDKRNRSERWALVKATPVLDDEGSVRMAVNIFRDITEDRREEDRRRVLAEASAELSSSLDYETTLRRLADLAVRRLSDICVIYLADHEHPRRLEVAHIDPRKRELLRELAGRIPMDQNPDHPAMQVMRTGEPILMPEIPTVMIEQLTEDREELRAIRDLGLKSSLIVPLATPQRILGALSLSTAESGRVFGADDLEVATELGRRAAAAMDNALLHIGEQQARRDAEASAERIARLQAVTAALSERLTTGEVAEVVVEHGVQALRAETGSLVLLDEDGVSLRIERSVGTPGDIRSVGAAGEVLEGPSSLAVDPTDPIAEAVRTGQPVTVPSEATHERQGDDASGGVAGMGLSMAVPLLVKGEAIGALGLTFRGRDALSDNDRSFLIALAQQSSQALERARLYEAERAARAQAQSARERLSFLAEASEALSTSLDQSEILFRLADLAIPRLADWCIVDVMDAGELRQVAVNHIEPEKAELARELRERYPPAADDHPIYRALRTGNPEMMAVVDETGLNLVDDDHRRLLEELGNDSYLVVPLLARGRVLGVVSFISGPSGRRYAAADLALAEDLIRRAALALDNARLYEEQSHAAQALQRSLLPSSLPEVPGMEIAARYRAAGAANEVGGDFYDVFDLADDRWAVVIGDVCGKGPDAAALTGLARHTIRTAALHHRGPAQVLSVLNDAILKEDPLRFCTAALAVASRSERGIELSVACGGHPPPLVLRADGTVDIGGQPGTLLGTFPDPKLPEHAVVLGPGDAVLLYTDGVVEDARVGTPSGEERLRQLLGLCVGLEASRIADRIERHAAEYRAGEPRDDIAILVLRVLP